MRSVGIIAASLLPFATCLAPAAPTNRQAALRRPRQRHVCMGNPVVPSRFRYCTKSYLESTLKDRTLAGELIAAGLPRWATLLDEGFFLIASLMFVYASFDFYPGVPFTKYVEGCQIFVIGSIIYLALAVFGLYEIFEDARLAGRQPAPWNIVESLLYVVGSALFLVGTFLFTPDLRSAGWNRAAAWEEIEAAATEAVATEAAALKASGQWDTTLAAPDLPLFQEVTVPWFGKTFTFVVQANPDVSPLPEAYTETFQLPEAAVPAIELGDGLFVAGSLLFSIAAFVSAVKAAGESGTTPDAQARRRTAVATSSLYELGGVAFVVGTLGFIPAEALGIVTCPEGVHKLTFAGATLFVAGSIFYSCGSALTLAVESRQFLREEAELGGYAQAESDSAVASISELSQAESDSTVASTTESLEL